MMPAPPRSSSLNRGQVSAPNWQKFDSWCAIRRSTSVASASCTVACEGFVPTIVSPDKSVRLTEPLTITVTYEMPLNAPFVKRLFGGPGGRFGPVWSRQITSTYTLQAEVPRTVDATLRIEYAPR